MVVKIVTSAAPTGAGDKLSITYHGNNVTHMDAFGHRFFDGKMYNGFSWEELTREGSDKTESIYDVRNGVLTRVSYFPDSATRWGWLAPLSTPFLLGRNHLALILDRRRPSFGIFGTVAGNRRGRAALCW